LTIPGSDASEASNDSLERAQDTCSRDHAASRGAP